MSSATASILDALSVDDDLSQYLSDPTQISNWMVSVARDLRQEIKDLEPLAMETATADAAFKKAHAEAFIKTFEPTMNENSERVVPKYTETARKSFAEIEASELYLEWQMKLMLFRAKRDAVDALNAVLNALQTLHRHAASLTDSPAQQRR